MFDILSSFWKLHELCFRFTYSTFNWQLTAADSDGMKWNDREQLRPFT